MELGHEQEGSISRPGMTWSRQLQPCTPLTALYFDVGGFSFGSCNARTRENSSARVEVGGRGNHMVRSSCTSGLADAKVVVEEEMVVVVVWVCLDAPYSVRGTWA